MPNAFKNGTLFFLTEKPLSDERIKAIPEKYKPENPETIVRAHITTHNETLLTENNILGKMLFG